jgi:hypothetical protein
MQIAQALSEAGVAKSSDFEKLAKKAHQQQEKQEQENISSLETHEEHRKNALVACRALKEVTTLEDFVTLAKKLLLEYGHLAWQSISSRTGTFSSDPRISRVRWALFQIRDANDAKWEKAVSYYLKEVLGEDEMLELKKL